MAFAKDTLILMSDGHAKKITDIKIGDKVMLPDLGLSSEVTDISQIDNAQRYKINLSDSYYTVTQDHILKLICGASDLKDSLGRELNRGHVFSISVEDYLAQDSYFKNNVYGYHSSLSFKYVPQDYPAYDLGVILTYTDYINKILSAHNIKELHLPHHYIYNNRDIRLGLLAGLADGFGKYDGKALQFELPDNKLRSDILFLVKSLGFSAFCTDDNLLNVLGKLSTVPTEILHMKDSKINNDWYKISVERQSDGKAYSIDIKDNNKLILMDDFSVVHV